VADQEAERQAAALLAHPAVADLEREALRWRAAGHLASPADPAGWGQGQALAAAHYQAEADLPGAGCYPGAEQHLAAGRPWAAGRPARAELMRHHLRYLRGERPA
jgi:hypothetical protein